MSETEKTTADLEKQLAELQKAYDTKDNTIIIDAPFLDDKDDEKKDKPDDSKQDKEDTQKTADTVLALSKEIEKLQKKLEVQEKETEDAKKQVLLDRLKEAKYNPDDFKELDLKSLEITIKALSTKDGRIRIDSKPDKKEDHRITPSIEMVEPGTGRVYDFWTDEKLGKTPKTKK